MHRIPHPAPAGDVVPTACSSRSTTRLGSPAGYAPYGIRPNATSHHEQEEARLGRGSVANAGPGRRSGPYHLLSVDELAYTDAWTAAAAAQLTVESFNHARGRSLITPRLVNVERPSLGRGIFDKSVFRNYRPHFPKEVCELAGADQFGAAHGIVRDHPCRVVED